MGITVKQKELIEKLTKNNERAKARIQSRVNNLLMSKGKKPVQKLAEGGNIYGSTALDLIAKQNQQQQNNQANIVTPIPPQETTPVITEEATPAVMPPVPTPEPPKPSITYEQPDNLVTFNPDGTTTRPFAQNRKIDPPIIVPMEGQPQPPISPTPTPTPTVETPTPTPTVETPTSTPTVETPTSTVEPSGPELPPITTDPVYDPKDGPPQEVDTNEMLEGLNWAQHSQKGIDMLLQGDKLPSDDMFYEAEDEDGNKILVPNPAKYTIGGGSENWTFTFEDGTSTVVNRAEKSKAVKTLKEEITPVITRLKDRGYEEAKNTYNEQFKIYKDYLDTKYTPDPYDPSIEVDFVKNLQDVKKEVADLSSKLITMPPGKAPPVTDEDGNTPPDERTEEEKVQFEKYQEAAKQLSELQGQQAVAEANLKSAGTKSGDEMLSAIQDDPTQFITKAEVSKLADKVSPDQFIDKDTGQVTTKTEAGTTLIDKAAQAVTPDDVTASEKFKDATVIKEDAETELDKTDAAKKDDLSQEVTAQTLEETRDEAIADELLKVAENRISKVKEDLDLTVTKEQQAKYKGDKYTAIKVDVAVGDVLADSLFAEGSVKLEELPPPSIIAEDNMAQAKMMQDKGLVPDARPVAAKLGKFSVKDGTLAMAMEGEVQALDTVQGQLSKLMLDFDDGTPSWAAGAIRAANAALSGRGLGASSMAGTAILEAAMEAALPIAQADAQVYANMNLTNLSNRQGVSLANAAAQQGRELQNLTNQQQANLQLSVNAYGLQTDNLSNRQQTELSNAQIRATLQGKNLDNTQQSNILVAARFAESANINLSNKQDALMQDNVGELQQNLANLSSKSQAYVASANLAASLQGKKLDADQQVAIINAAKFSDAANLVFTTEQQNALHNSKLLQSIGLAELSSSQAATLQNAANFAALDATELNFMQQAQVENARNFLQLDLQNLTNDQQVVLFKAQARQQALLSDQAAENAAKQFNAESENQVAQFNANLRAQVSQFNATQTNAIAQFNAGEANATARFNSQLEADRQKFNAANALVVAQSNTQWRRDIATIDTAAENAANQAAALAANNLTEGALGELWQQERDLMDHAQTNSNNELDRINNITVEKIRKDATIDAVELKANLEADANIGQAIFDIVTGEIFS
jgi:hypothetical protein